MTTQAEVKTALADLAARCEKATGPDRELDAEIYVALDANRENRDALAINGAVGSWVPDFTASLDAAMTLVPEGWYWQVGQGNHAWAAVYENPIPPAMRVDPIAATPALALCAAALRARAAA
jgi:hypothetical protein